MGIIFTSDRVTPPPRIWIFNSPRKLRHDLQPPHAQGPLLSPHHAPPSIPGLQNYKEIKKSQRPLSKNCKSCSPYSSLSVNLLFLMGRKICLWRNLKKIGGVENLIIQIYKKKGFPHFSQHFRYFLGSAFFFLDVSSSLGSDFFRYMKKSEIKMENSGCVDARSWDIFFSPSKT